MFFDTFLSASAQVSESPSLIWRHSSRARSGVHVLPLPVFEPIGRSVYDLLQTTFTADLQHSAAKFRRPVDRQTDIWRLTMMCFDGCRKDLLNYVDDESQKWSTSDFNLCCCWDARLMDTGILVGLSDARLAKAIGAMHKHPETS